MNSSVFALQKQLRKLNFQRFLPPRNPLVASFNETGTSTSRKDVVEQGLMKTNSLKTIQTF